ncbi:MAG: head maturation protease, ClpP-related [Bacillota bacterium]
MKKYWSMKKTTPTVAELLLYGEISSYEYWGDEVTPKQINEELNALGAVDEINVRINSPGGEVFAGVAIHAMLTRHNAKINVFVDGYAASIASIIAMAGDTITMAKGSYMMIHNPSGGVRGTAAEMRKYADVLDQIRDSMVGIYSAKTGKTSEDIIPLLDAETWMDADSAVAQGFAHGVEQGVAVAASIRGKTAIINGVEMDWSKFKNAPKLPEDKPAAPTAAVDIELIKTIVAETVKSLLPNNNGEPPTEPPKNEEDESEPNALDNDPGVFLLRKKLELKQKTL